VTRQEAAHKSAFVRADENHRFGGIVRLYGQAALDRFHASRVAMIGVSEGPASNRLPETVWYFGRIGAQASSLR
jgi:hypothetical protein